MDPRLALSRAGLWPDAAYQGFKETMNPCFVPGRLVRRTMYRLRVSGYFCFHVLVPTSIDIGYRTQVRNSSLHFIPSQRPLVTISSLPGLLHQYPGPHKSSQLLHAQAQEVGASLGRSIHSMIISTLFLNNPSASTAPSPLSNPSPLSSEMIAHFALYNHTPLLCIAQRVPPCDICAIIHPD